MDELSKAGLIWKGLIKINWGTLHKAIGDLLLAAELRKPNDQLDRVDVVGDDHQTSLLSLNQLGDVVQTIMQNCDFLLVLLLVLGLSLGSLQETLLLFSLGLRGVLLEEGEEILGYYS